MKTARWYGILYLSFCLWLLLFPPWMMRWGSYSHSLGRHWSRPFHWDWNEYMRKSFFVPNLAARIDYQELLYEAAIGLVALALLFLLLPALEMPIRRIRQLRSSSVSRNSSSSSLAMKALRVIIYVCVFALVAYASYSRGNKVQNQIADWVSANEAYGRSTDCGNLTREQCRIYWKETVEPNLRRAEQQWTILDADVADEIAHRSVSSSCRVSYDNLRAAMNQYYPIEDKVVVAMENGENGEIDRIGASEVEAMARVKATSKIHAVECKNQY